MERLLDRSRRNMLLYFRPLKIGTLLLDDAVPEAIASLLDGESVPLSRLLPEADQVQTAAIVQAIRRRAQANSEEKGIETLFLAIGMASWPAADGGRPPEAAVLLLPMIVEVRGRGGRLLALKRSGDAQVNLVLLQEMESALGRTIVADSILDDAGIDGEPFDPVPALRLLAEAGHGVDGFTVRPRAVLGNFSYQKMAMVRDLSECGEAMVRHDLLAALAGDAAARATILGARTAVDPRELDRTLPESEFLVLDADSSQQRVVAAVLRGQDGVIHGPPGTGKSQTIVNLLTELAAHGSRSLFVAEKRAALEVVLRRLTEVGLGHLVLDLHGADISRRDIARRIVTNLDLVREALPADGTDMHRQFAERRQQLNDHVRRLHMPREPSAMSVYELQGQLLRLPAAAQSVIRWRGPALARLDGPTAQAVETLLLESSGFETLLLRTDPSPWTGAAIPNGSTADRALDLAVDLAGQHWPALLADLDGIVAATHLRKPTNLEEAHTLLTLVDEVTQTLAAYQDGLFERDLKSMAEDLKPGLAGRLQSFWAWCTNAAYRQARSQANAFRREGVPAARSVAEDMRDAADRQATWQVLSLDTGKAERPCSLPDVGRMQLHLEAVLNGVEGLAPILGRSDLGRLPIGQFQELLEGLAADAITPRRLPRLMEIEGELERAGGGPFLKELRSVPHPAALWPKIFRRAWLASCLDAALGEHPALAGFSGRTHEQFVEAFKELDKRRLALAVQRVRRTHAERVIEAMNRAPNQEALVRREAGKRTRHMSLRRLLAQAPDVLTALFPCWMASPLAVSQLMGADRRYFDVVLFDEASQVLPEDAAAALLRATSAVVAGDRHQLPPTTFFAGGEGEDELTTEQEDEPATAGFESLLDLMSGIVEPWPLDWHYRSKDERLIAFANHHVYGDRLVTFPSANEAPAMAHVLVPAAGPDSQEDSPSGEVRRVVDLIMVHAQQRPRETLGVITLGIKHAGRIQAALDEARQNHPELDGFFNESQPERFFVKNLERVQGDERDAIILSVGVGDGRGGRVDYRAFGPLNGEGGHRRLNVAITRAKQRMTLVSSFTHEEMDPTRARTGTALLRNYLQYAASGGESFGDGRAIPMPLNPFEVDIAEALEAAGIPVVPQWGASRYRIDLVARHPTRPGRLVLAMECDGATYHSAATARDRDRLRQQHLEALGWTFHRIWSTDWFLRRDEEIRRAQEAYRRAVARVDDIEKGEAVVLHQSAAAPAPAAESPPETASVAGGGHGQRGPRPSIVPRQQIDDYADYQLFALLEWVQSDGHLRTDDEIVDELVQALGYQRRGPRIMTRLRRVVAAARQRRLISA